MKTVLTTLLAICVCLVIGCGQGGEAKKFEKTKAKAEKGDAIAQTNLGLMYQEGKGVLEDDKEAVKWWHKAAYQGFPMAQRNLGAIYYRGDGVLKDYVTSEAWYSIAAANGMKRDKDSLAKLMTAEQIAKARALTKEMLAKNPKLINNK